MCQSRNDCGYKPKGAAASSAKMFRDGTFFFSLQKRRQLFLRVENCSVLTKPFTRRGCIAFVSDRSTMFYKGMNSNVHPEEFGTQPWRRIIEELPAAIRRKMGIFPFFLDYVDDVSVLAKEKVTFSFPSRHSPTTTLPFYSTYTRISSLRNGTTDFLSLSYSCAAY